MKQISFDDVFEQRTGLAFIFSIFDKKMNKYGLFVHFGIKCRRLSNYISRSIRCIEHTNRAKFITPFVGGQLDICEAFGFKIPDGCTPKYASRKKSAPHRGRPSKPKTTTLES